MPDTQEWTAAVASYFRERQWERAERSLREVLRASPRDAYAEFCLARTLGAQGKHAEALASYERTLRLEPVWRWYVIQAAIARLQAKTYLEIGVSTGENFRRIAAAVKIGIDPVAPPATLFPESVRGTSYFQMTSDAFFASHAGVLEGRGIDVAFVDGLHTYAQTLVDVQNCLRHLNPAGVVLVHDCNPTTEAMATPARSFEEAIAGNAAGPTQAWTGDVWKAVVDLRASRADLTVCVLDCDFGVGVVVQRSAAKLLPHSPREILRWTYHDLAARRSELLDLRPPVHLFQMIE